MANITMANKTNNPIWSKGAMAFMMDFSTTCKPKFITFDQLYVGFEKISMPLTSLKLC